MSRRGLRAEVEKEKEVATALLTGNAARDLAEVAKRIALPEADASYILKVKRKSLPPFLLIIFFKFELQRANPSHCFGATFHFSRALTRQYVCSRANRLTCSCTMGRLVALLIDILITADTEPTQYISTVVVSTTVGGLRCRSTCSMQPLPLLGRAGERYRHRSSSCLWIQLK